MAVSVLTSYVIKGKTYNQGDYFYPAVSQSGRAQSSGLGAVSIALNTNTQYIFDGYAVDSSTNIPQPYPCRIKTVGGGWIGWFTEDIFSDNSGHARISYWCGGGRALNSVYNDNGGNSITIAGSNKNYLQTVSTNNSITVYPASEFGLQKSGYNFKCWGVLISNDGSIDNHYYAHYLYPGTTYNYSYFKDWGTGAIATSGTIVNCILDAIWEKVEPDLPEIPDKFVGDGTITIYDENKQPRLAQCYIFHNEAWKQVIPFIYSNKDKKWKECGNSSNSNNPIVYQCSCGCGCNEVVENEGDICELCQSKEDLIDCAGNCNIVDHRDNFIRGYCSTCFFDLGGYYCEECGSPIIDSFGHSADCSNYVCYHEDLDTDHFCDYCGEKISECEDTDGDGYCDWCGQQMEPDSSDHNCEIDDHELDENGKCLWCDYCDHRNAEDINTPCPGCGGYMGTDF